MKNKELASLLSKWLLENKDTDYETMWFKNPVGIVIREQTTMTGNWKPKLKLNKKRKH